MEGMASRTGIKWTDSTWNPTTGCDRISAGCDHCYALDQAARMKAMGSPGYQNDGDPRTSGPGFGLTLHPDRLDLPLRWERPRFVFVNSMSDLFHDEVPDEFIAQVFDVMTRAPQHVFQVLTKRSHRLARSANRFEWPSNLWVGVTVESGRYGFRLDHLRSVPAARRFVSAEPLIGDPGGLNLTGIDWVIAGGESGPLARACQTEWLRSLRDDCVRDGAAFWFKQWGAYFDEGGTPRRWTREDGVLLDGVEYRERPPFAS